MFGGEKIRILVNIFRANETTYPGLDFLFCAHSRRNNSWKKPKRKNALSSLFGKKSNLFWFLIISVILSAFIRERHTIV